VSLFWYRRRVEAAAAGVLAPAKLERLREHLRGCEACRAHYDRAVAMRHALAPDAVRKERDEALLQQLLPRLETRTAQAPEAARSLRPWVPAFAAALAAAAIAFVWQPWAKPETLRGGVDAPPAPLVVRVYVERGGGKAELLGELPGSRVLSVPRGARVQVSVRGAGAVDVTLSQKTQHVAAGTGFVVADDAWTVEGPAELSATDAAGHRVSCRVEVTPQ